jgi:hypothetical protein
MGGLDAKDFKEVQGVSRSFKEFQGFALDDTRRELELE